MRAICILLLLTCATAAIAEENESEWCKDFVVTLTRDGFLMIDGMAGDWVQILVDEWFWSEPGDIGPADWLEVVECALRPEGGTVLMEVRSIRTGELLGKRTYAHDYLPVD